MFSLAWPVVVNGCRTIVGSGARGSWVPLGVGLVLVATLEIYWVQRAGVVLQAREPELAVITWAILSLVVVAALASPASSRLPHRSPDIAWLYTAPVALWKIAFATAIWHALIRSGVWLVAGIGVDLANMLRQGSAAGATVRAAMALPIIWALSLWTFGTGSARGSRGVTRVLVAVGGATAATMLISLLVNSRQEGSLVDGLGAALPAPLVQGLGGGLVGHPTLFGSVVVASIGAAGVVLMLGAAGPRLRESMVLDAYFWEGFAPAAAAPSPRWRKRPSWRRGSRLVGPAAFLWFELALLRRSGYQVLSHVALFVMAALVGYWEPPLLIVFIVLAALGVLVGGYTAGAAVHMRWGTLFVLPGKLAAKTIAAELPSAVPPAVSLSLALGLGGLVAGFAAKEIVQIEVLGLSVLVMALGIRIFTAAACYSAGILQVASAYFLYAFAVTSFAVALQFAIFKTLPSLGWTVGMWDLSVAAAGWGLAMWALAIRSLHRNTCSPESRRKASTAVGRLGA